MQSNVNWPRTQPDSNRKPREEVVAGSDEIDPSEANRPRFNELPPDYKLLTDQLVRATPLHGRPNGKVTRALKEGSVACTSA